MNPDWFERVMASTTKNPGTGCWEYNGVLTHNGYGRVGYAGKNIRLHRLSYQSYRGEIPKGMLVCHHCDVRNCWNPRHLFLGTHQDNFNDMIAKGRQKFAEPMCPPRGPVPRGEKNHFHKLKEQEVIRAHALWQSGLLKKDIAEILGVNESAIRKILTGETWAHLHPEKSREFVDGQRPRQGELRPSQQTPSSHHLARSQTNQDQRRQSP